MTVSARFFSMTGFLLCAVIALPSIVSAQQPSITSTSPQAAMPGAAVDVVLKGGSLAGPTQLWTSFPAEAALSPDVKDNGTNAAQVTYRITVPEGTPAGIHAIRAVTPTGVSKPVLFLVDDLASVAEKKPNNSTGAAQPLSLPIAVDGTVDALARHYFKFSVEQGQTVSFEVLARRIGSPLDPLIRILDATGRELAYSDDAAGTMGDARLCHTFKDAGEYFVELRDISYTGGAGHRYRLRIGDFPCVSAPYPMGAKAGTTATIGFAGSHLRDAQPVSVNVPSDPSIKWIPVAAKSADGQSSGFAVLAVSPQDEAVEQEPNNDQSQATRVELGANINGRFETPGDIDRFIFKAAKGQRFLFTGITRRQGAPTDLHVRLLDATGKQLAIAEDSGKNDALINHTFPADGDYVLEVQDLHRRGGPEFAYRITTAPYQPGFDLSTSGETINVPASGTAFVTVTATRRGYNGPIEISGENLPEGVTVTPAVIGPGRPNAVVTIQNGTTAAGAISEIRLIGTAKIGNADYRAVATATTAQQGLFSAMPWPPLNLSEKVALAAAPAPNFFTLTSDPATVVLGPDLSATVTVKANRTKDFGEAIALAVEPAKAGLPPEVAVAAKPIEKGKNEIAIVVSAKTKAPLGEFTIVLKGTGKKGKASSSQAAPGIRIRLQAPYSLKAENITIARGAKAKMKVTAVRNPAYTGPIILTFVNLPKGVTAAPATIEAGKNEVEVELTAAADAAVGIVKNTISQGEGLVGKTKIPGKSPAFELTVQ
ncbi:hypothetical protein Mal52_50230 [Symmachiella dynata]|uniref:Subtilase-type serine protease n=2 Tax=Symmachiella dynata TaxID=2527995 RepID=A0A517ZVI9_9PLAN|nr:hypothetical protein [Symmachiella dynata]QDU46502.1 hypothetical protein Mal52_50230 [Symmachiella dynata]